MRTKANWVGIFFGSLWFLGAGLGLALYLTDSLPHSIQVPRFVGWLYDLIGFIPASIIQLVLCFFIILDSLPRKIKIEKKDDKIIS